VYQHVHWKKGRERERKRKEAAKCKNVTQREQHKIIDFPFSPSARRALKNRRRE
jgi:hypothetical protein